MQLETYVLSYQLFFGFNRSQSYALPEDFSFVEEFIKAHVPEKCAIKERV